MRVCLCSRGYESSIVQEVGRPNQIHGTLEALPFRALAMQGKCSCPAGPLGKSLQPQQECPQGMLQYEGWKAHRRRDRCCRQKVFLAEAPNHATDGLQPSQLVRIENAADSPCGLTPCVSGAPLLRVRLDAVVRQTHFLNAKYSRAANTAPTATAPTTLSDFIFSAILLIASFA